MQDTVKERLSENLRMEAAPEAGDLISFLMQQGLGEATDVLLIDESLCIGCDNCEKACAETHGGTSRLDRAAGPFLRTGARADVVPPLRGPALHEGLPAGRDPARTERRGVHPGQLHRLRQLRTQLPVWRHPDGGQQKEGAGPARLAADGQRAGTRASASRGCDRAPRKRPSSATCARTCQGGPACVRACPTGAALRMSPDEFVNLTKRAS